MNLTVVICFISLARKFYFSVMTQGEKKKKKAEKTVLCPPGASCYRYFSGGRLGGQSCFSTPGCEKGSGLTRGLCDSGAAFSHPLSTANSNGSFSQFWLLSENFSLWQWLTNRPIPGAGEQWPDESLKGEKCQTTRSDLHTLEPEIHGYHMQV